MPIKFTKLYVALFAWAMLLTAFMSPVKAQESQPQRCAKQTIIEQVLSEHHGEYPMFRMKAAGRTWRFHVNLTTGTWTHTYLGGAPDSEAIECIYTAGTGFSAEGFR